MYNVYNNSFINDRNFVNKFVYIDYAIIITVNKILYFFYKILYFIYAKYFIC